MLISEAEPWLNLIVIIYPHLGFRVHVCHSQKSSYCSTPCCWNKKTLVFYWKRRVASTVNGDQALT